MRPRAARGPAATKAGARLGTAHVHWPKLAPLRPCAGALLSIASALLAATLLVGCQWPATGPTLGEAPAPGTPRRSGFDDMSPATQAMQRDDTANPAWLWVEDGRQRFAATCARCHTVAAMAGVAARYPAWDATAGRPLTLGQRIADCHARHVAPSQGTSGAPGAPGAARWAPEDEARLALEAFVALQSRGRPITPPADERLAPWRARGAALFRQRLGQLDLSCAHCHERYAGRRLAGSVIPQGHPTGYPIYRLEWQGMGSLQRRLRGCLNGVRAEPFGPDDADATAMEVYLMSRSAGLPMETPAVRP